MYIYVKKIHPYMHTTELRFILLLSVTESHASEAGVLGKRVHFNGNLLRAGNFVYRLGDI